MKTISEISPGSMFCFYKTMPSANESYADFHPCFMIWNNDLTFAYFCRQELFVFTHAEQWSNMFYEIIQ